jgi:hypothetical protein
MEMSNGSMETSNGSVEASIGSMECGNELGGETSERVEGATRSMGKPTARWQRTFRILSDRLETHASRT